MSLLWLFLSFLAAAAHAHARVVLRNVPCSASSGQITNALSRFGQIKEIHIHQTSSQQKGTALVTFETAKAAKAALATSCLNLKGGAVAVEKAEDTDLAKTQAEWVASIAEDMELQKRRNRIQALQFHSETNHIENLMAKLQPLRDSREFSIALQAYLRAEPNWPEKPPAETLWRQMKRRGDIVPDIDAHNAMLEIFQEQDEFDKFYDLWNKMNSKKYRPSPNVASFNIVLEAFPTAFDSTDPFDEWEQYSRNLLKKMKNAGLRPDIETYHSIFRAAHAGIGDNMFHYTDGWRGAVMRFFARMVLVDKIRPTVESYKLLLDCYAWLDEQQSWRRGHFFSNIKSDLAANSVPADLKLYRAALLDFNGDFHTWSDRQMILQEFEKSGLQADEAFMEDLEDF
mmetsp:Transcript_40458/g.88788  ORF Transcript_40458/g.88788 Transcript_40458/m.88788 type:complete len:399 (-) Transcript_40458:565-1761(-)|eukprot:4006022-Pleurochrysis_carterae.AAC.3